MKFGNAFSEATEATTRNDTIVTLTPSRESSSLSCLRHASRSVMSASSLWVTCGIITQLRASTGPEIRWIRERSTRSISPNFEKSIDGHGGRFRPGPAPPAGAGRRPRRRRRSDGPRSTNAWTSSLVIRPLRPLPLTWCRSTPSSRATRRTAGLAYTGPPPFRSRSGRRRGCRRRRGRCAARRGSALGLGARARPAPRRLPRSRPRRQPSSRSDGVVPPSWALESPAPSDVSSVSS